MFLKVGLYSHIVAHGYKAYIQYYLMDTDIIKLVLKTTVY